MSERPTVVVSTHWRHRGSELSYVIRAIAGAATRSGPVAVLVPDASGPGEPDGVFDLVGLGPAEELSWPAALSADCTVIVDELTSPVSDLLSRVAPHRVLFLSTASDASTDPQWLPLRVVGTSDVHASPLACMYVAVNPLAERQRHHGFGFTGYQLVLSGGSSGDDEPPAAAAWLTSAFHESEVVVIEHAVASVWKGRALRGRVSVDTRMDLWRLLAHANACVDLAPGSLLARECVEALRFGTPIIVPEGSGAATVHADVSGGATFSDPGDLIAAAAALASGPERSAVSRQGRRYADRNFGDVSSFVSQVTSVLTMA